MIASVFKKSTPFNYSLIAILILVFYLILFFQSAVWQQETQVLSAKIGAFILFLASAFVVNFISKKNLLTKDNAYVLLFYFLLHLFFPKILLDEKLVFSNFFILLAQRRLISLQTLKSPKEKIFDASIFILLASLFHFWCIFFFLLIYISIIFHVSRDYRNWLIPFFAIIAFISVFLFLSLIFEQNWITNYIESIQVYFSIDYFKNNNQNIIFSVYTVYVFFFLINALLNLASKPLNMQATHKKLIASFFLGVAVFVFSVNKSNEMLLFTFFPLAVMMTNFVELSSSRLNQNIVVIVTILVAVSAFFVQL